MTKKDFELVASAVRAAIMAYPVCEQLTKEGRRELAKAIAGKLAQSNANFHHAKFLKACEV